MLRDVYKSRVYEAEDALRFIANQDVTTVDFYGSTLDLPMPRKFGDLAGVQRFVDAVCALASVRNKYPVTRKAPTVVKYDGDHQAQYTYSSNEIAVPDHHGCYSSWAMDEMIILHELAHYFVRNSGPAGTLVAAHGTEFCLCFMFLLERVLGGGWKTLLMHGLDQRGVPLGVHACA